MSTPLDRDEPIGHCETAQPWVTIPARTTGFIQGIDADILARLAPRSIDTPYRLAAACPETLGTDATLERWTTR